MFMQNACVFCLPVPRTFLYLVRPNLHGRQLCTQRVDAGLNLCNFSAIDVRLSKKARHAVSMQTISFALQTLYDLMHRCHHVVEC